MIGWEGVSIPKRYEHGTHRCCDPDETFRRISPHFASIGLTRIADVTGLDSIGIPVFLAVRPNSRSLSVSQGKGLTPMEAKVSAAMESIELHHAENLVRPAATAPYSEIARRREAVDPKSLPLHRRSLYSDDLPLAWIPGTDLVTGSEVLVPHNFVSADRVVGPIREPRCFHASSNGLAAGNHFLEAASHGILEVVERDATHLWRVETRSGRAVRTVDLGTVDDPSTRLLIERIEEAGFLVLAWDQTSDIGIPAFGCVLVERRGGERVLPAQGPYSGFGCHLSKEVALTRALTEAVQSRLTFISGARDDLFRASYSDGGRANALLELLGCGIGRPPGLVDFREIPSLATRTLEGDVETAIGRLGARGFERVIAVDLTDREIGIPVVKIIVPGMEMDRGPEANPIPGPRARRVLEEKRA